MTHHISNEYVKLNNHPVRISALESKTKGIKASATDSLTLGDGDHSTNDCVVGEISNTECGIGNKTFVSGGANRNMISQTNLGVVKIGGNTGSNTIEFYKAGGKVADVGDIVANTAKNSYPSGDATKVGHLTITGSANIDTILSNTNTNNAKNSYPSGDATKVGYLTITGSANIDTILSNTNTNNAKISYSSSASTQVASNLANITELLALQNDYLYGRTIAIDGQTTDDDMDLTSNYVIYEYKSIVESGCLHYDANGILTTDTTGMFLVKASLAIHSGADERGVMIALFASNTSNSGNKICLGSDQISYLDSTSASASQIIIDMVVILETGQDYSFQARSKQGGSADISNDTIDMCALYIKRVPTPTAITNYGTTEGFKFTGQRTYS